MRISRGKPSLFARPWRESRPIVLLALIALNASVFVAQVFLDAFEPGFVRDYLAIEEVRFRDRLHTSVCASNGALECLVPPLILQPIVENAVRHGISAVSTSGTVDVRAEMLARHVRLTVRDDGPGMSAATSQPGSGTGLKNTRERLAQLYGTDAELHICDGPSGGTIVRIDIPLARSENNPRADE